MTESAEISGASDGENISKSKIWQVIGASSAGTVIEWYDFLYFRQSGGDHFAAFLSKRQRYTGLDSISFNLCCWIRGAAIWCFVFWSNWRFGRPKICFFTDASFDGGLNRGGWLFAHLRNHRNACSDRFDRYPDSSGFGARR